MKNSGIEWIGEIPDSWNIIRLKDVIESHFGGCWGEEPSEDDGILCIRIADFDFGKQTIKSSASTKRQYSTAQFEKGLLQDGDLILEKSGGGEKTSVGRVVVFEQKMFPSKTMFANFSECLRVKRQLHNEKYCAYLLKALYYTKDMRCFYHQTTGIQNLDIAEYLSMNLCFPSKFEQDLIVKHLDRKLMAVDKLIDIQQAQIDKLKEYKQSVITEAVTKGLDPTVPMKDSGVEWIGMIPCEWEIRRGKNVVDLLNKPVYNTDDVITCFRDGEVTLRKNRREEGFTFSDKEIGYQGIDVGDLVIHGMDGFAGAIGISDSRGKGSPVLIVLDSKQNKKFLMYYLRSLAYRDIFLALSTGIRVRSCDLRWNKISTLPFLIPSLEEQYGIVKYIEKRLYDIDKLIAIKQAKIDKLQEYKKSLIYEYVTGKKEVVQ